LQRYGYRRWAALHFGYWWLSLLLAIPAAGFLVRLFMIQHDCGHGSFFSHRMANDWVGRVIGVLTLTPYDFWRQTHAIHHATSGHLERRGIGDVDTLTVREYLSRSFWGRLCYRAYRHPLIMFGVGPAYLFILQYRLPVGLLFNGWQPWVSTMATNVAIAAVVAVLIWYIGVWPFMLVQLPIILLAGSVGVWLFYVQHQFERTFWAHEDGCRRPPCPSPVQPYSLLPSASGAARASRTSLREPPYAASELPVREACALGRKSAASSFFS
jgi:acyl-lipid omega-6 desaturase (Delta-12 desaturase)